MKNTADIKALREALAEAIAEKEAYKAKVASMAAEWAKDRGEMEDLRLENADLKKKTRGC